MRELKFRVWNGYLKKEFKAYDRFRVEIDGAYLKIEPYRYDNDYAIEQYTGLKDKNGREIYEGDIVKDRRSDEFYIGIYKVEFDLDRAGFVPFACGDGCGCCETDVINDSGDVEIVGNIHENPELLGSKE